MKKFFGVLLLLIGLLLVAIGMYGMGNTNGEIKGIESQIQNEFTQQYKSNIEKDLVIGGAVSTVGLLFNIIGIVLLATKTNKQRRMEIELDVLKNKDIT